MRKQPPQSPGRVPVAPVRTGLDPASAGPYMVVVSIPSSQIRCRIVQRLQQAQHRCGLWLALTGESRQRTLPTEAGRIESGPFPGQQIVVYQQAGQQGEKAAGAHQSAQDFDRGGLDRRFGYWQSDFDETLPELDLDLTEAVPHDPWILQQISGIHSATCQWVSGSGHDPVLVLYQYVTMHSRVCFAHGVERDDHVDLACQERRHQVRQNAANHAYTDAWPLLPLIETPYGVIRGARMIQQQAPGSGEPHTAYAALEYAGTERVLQRLDALAQRLLGAPGHRCRAGEAAMLDDGEKKAELTQIHDLSLSHYNEQL